MKNKHKKRFREGSAVATGYAYAVTKNGKYLVRGADEAIMCRSPRHSYQSKAKIITFRIIKKRENAAKRRNAVIDAKVEDMLRLLDKAK